MPKIETGDGEFIEVSEEDIIYEDDETRPKFTQDELDGIVKKRLSREDRKLKNELLEDNDFFQKMASKRGIELREDGKPKGHVKDERFDELKKKASMYDSMKPEYESLKQNLEETRKTKRDNQILQHVDNIKPDLKDAFKTMVSKNLTYDEQEDRWIAVDETGEPDYLDGDVYGVDGVVNKFKEDYPSFFKSTSVENFPEDNHTSGRVENLGLKEKSQAMQDALKLGNTEKANQLFDEIASSKEE